MIILSEDMPVFPCPSTVIWMNALWICMMLRYMLKYHCKHTRQLRFRWFLIWIIIVFCFPTQKKKSFVTIWSYFSVSPQWVCKFNEFSPAQILRQGLESKDTRERGSEAGRQGYEETCSWVHRCLGTMDSSSLGSWGHCPTVRQASLPATVQFTPGAFVLGISVFPMLRANPLKSRESALCKAERGRNP